MRRFRLQFFSFVYSSSSSFFLFFLIESTCDSRLPYVLEHIFDARCRLLLLIVLSPVLTIVDRFRYKIIQFRI